VSDDSPGALSLLLETLAHFARDHALVLLAALFGLLALQSARLFWLRSAAGRKMAAHRDLGARGERRARKLLKKHGYQITSEQVGGTYEMFVDDQTCPVRLRADFIVQKRGETYVAEVKAGVESVKVTGRSTRRQLLEYFFAFDVTGVLLVDMQAEKISEVAFPPIKGR
jgi:hypothetical protein